MRYFFDDSCRKWLVIWVVGSLGWLQFPVLAEDRLPEAGVVGSGQTSAGTQEFTLANGLRVVVLEDHRAPTVVHMMWYRAGSLDEFNGTTGVAHVLEHMMFKGTRTLAAGEFSRRVAALGGRENAFTAKDYTAYYQQVEKSHLRDVMMLEADRMANLTLSKAEFDKEIKVVMEERRLRTDDNAHGRLYELLAATAFIASPVRNPVVGWMDDLQHMTYEDAQAWYQRWYAPNNAVLVVAGDVNVPEVKALAQQAYGAIKAKAVASRKPQVEPPQTGARRLDVKAPAENAYVALAFKAPRLDDVEQDVDPYALEVLSGILDGYDNARLPRSLVQTPAGGQRLADSVDAGYTAITRGPSLFFLQGTPAQGVAAQTLEAALRAQVALVARDGVSELELDRVKAQFVASQIYKRDSVFGRAMETGVAEMTGLSWKQLDRMLEKVQAVTSAQVQAVAGRYFGDDNLTVATLLPQPLDPHRVPKALPDEGHLR